MSRTVEGTAHGAHTPGGKPPRGHRSGHCRRHHAPNDCRPPAKGSQPKAGEPERVPLELAGGGVQDGLAPALAGEAASVRQRDVAADGGGVNGPIRTGHCAGGSDRASGGHGTHQNPQNLNAAHEQGGAERPRHRLDRHSSNLTSFAGGGVALGDCGHGRGEGGYSVTAGGIVVTVERASHSMRDETPLP